MVGLTSEELAANNFFELMLLSTHEIVIIILVVIGLSLLWRWYQDAHFEIETLNENIQSLDSKLKMSSQEIELHKSSLDNVLKNYFETWGLSKSEEDVCFYLIKGLAIKEIAQLRNTSERTVRNQATIIYDKANVAGRHELAAVFLNSIFNF